MVHEEEMEVLERQRREVGFVCFLFCFFVVFSFVFYLFLSDILIFLLLFLFCFCFWFFIMISFLIFFLWQNATRVKCKYGGTGK